MFDRNKDVDGKRLLIFNTKMYIRGTHNIDDMKKNLIYYVERLYRETDMDQITGTITWLMIICLLIFFYLKLL